MPAYDKAFPAALAVGAACLLASCSVIDSAGTAVSGFAAADEAETEVRNKAFVLEALQETLVKGNPDAVDRYFAPGMIQHNPDIPDGIEARKASVERLSGGGNFKAEFVRALADGDLVALHARYESEGRPPMIAFEVYRLEEGLVVEHWDNLIPEQAPNPSGHTQIDGATEITDLDKTEANKAKVVDFVTKSLIDQEQVDITRYISPTTYIQHNPQVADGLEGFGTFMKEMGEKGITMDYSKIHLVVGEGNFVLTASEGAFGGEPQAFYDLFRLEDGLIVEHWDVIAPMPGPDAQHNESGKF